MADKAIFVIVLNWNNRKDTLECLESLKSLKVPSGFAIKTIVSDNGSRDGSVAAIREKFDDVLVFQNGENLGFGQGNNRAIEKALEADSDFILILNNDTLVDANLVVNLLMPFDKNPEVGIVVPKIYFASGFEFHKNRYKKLDRGKVIWYAGGQIDLANIYGVHVGVDDVDRGQFSQGGETEYATGCCFLAKREVFETVGLFDPRYFLYLEDMDFSWRARKRGFKIFFEPKALIWHKNAQTAGGSGSKLQDYYITRNRLLFGFKYASFKTKFALLREAIINSFKNSIKRQAFYDFLKGRFGKGNINE